MVINCPGGIAQKLLGVMEDQNSYEAQLLFSSDVGLKSAISIARLYREAGRERDKLKTLALLSESLSKFSGADGKATFSNPLWPKEWKAEIIRSAITFSDEETGDFISLVFKNRMGNVSVAVRTIYGETNLSGDSKINELPGKWNTIISWFSGLAVSALSSIKKRVNWDNVTAVELYEVLAPLFRYREHLSIQGRTDRPNRASHFGIAEYDGKANAVEIKVWKGFSHQFVVIMLYREYAQVIGKGMQVAVFPPNERLKSVISSFAKESGDIEDVLDVVACILDNAATWEP